MYYSVAPNSQTPQKMRITLVVLIVILVASLWMMGQSDWHLNRNKHNKLPEGRLNHLKDNSYEDEVGLIWELQPTIKNLFHQPDQEIQIPVNPYANVTGAPEIDPKNPNLKFLSVTETGGSYEAILQPNGDYLITGKKKGTYNYGHPDGFFGNTKHVFFDIIPHFINSKYYK